MQGGSGYDPDIDLNGDGAIAASDFTLFRDMYLGTGTLGPRLRRQSPLPVSGLGGWCLPAYPVRSRPRPESR